MHWIFWQFQLVQGWAVYGGHGALQSDQWRLVSTGRHFVLRSQFQELGFLLGWQKRSVRRTYTCYLASRTLVRLIPPCALLMCLCFSSVEVRDVIMLSLFRLYVLVWKTDKIIFLPIQNEHWISLSNKMLLNITYMNTSSKNSISALLRQLMLYRAQGSRHYAAQVDDFMRSYMPGGELTQTPCGLAWRHGVGPLRYAGTSNEPPLQ